MYKKRTMITLLPEWERPLDRLKKEYFYDQTRAEMFRTLISIGLEAFKNKEEVIEK